MTKKLIVPRSFWGVVRQSYMTQDTIGFCRSSTTFSDVWDRNEPLIRKNVSKCTNSDYMGIGIWLVPLQYDRQQMRVDRVSILNTCVKNSTDFVLTLEEWRQVRRDYLENNRDKDIFICNSSELFKHVWEDSEKKYKLQVLANEYMKIQKKKTSPNLNSNVLYSVCETHNLVKWREGFLNWVIYNLEYFHG